MTGRPRKSPTARAPSRISAELLVRVEAWRRDRGPHMTKTAAIELLIEEGLRISDAVKAFRQSGAAGLNAFIEDWEAENAAARGKERDGR